MEPALIIAPTATSSRFAWEPGVPRGRYRDLVTGRFVSEQTIRVVLDQTLTSAAGTVRSLSDNLRAGRINLATWHLGMEQASKSIHLVSASLQMGGFQNMSQANYGAVGNILFNPSGSLEAGTAGEYAYLLRFAEQIEKEQIPLDGNFIRRAMGYVERGRTTFHRFERDLMKERGFDEAGRLRVPGDSCETAEGKGDRQGCVELGGLSLGTIKYVPIDDVVLIGMAVCFHNCRCRIFYRNSGTGEVWPVR